MFDGFDRFDLPPLEGSEDLFKGIPVTGKEAKRACLAAAAARGVSSEGREPSLFGLRRCASAAFLTDELRHDMPAIAREFLAHQNSDFFLRVQTADRHCGISGCDFFASSAVYGAVIDLIFSQAEDHESYAHALLVNLIRTYHGSTYRAVRKFSRLRAEDVFALSDVTDGTQMLGKSGRIAFVLFAARTLGIETDDEVLPLYFFLDSIGRELDRQADEAAVSNEDFEDLVWNARDELELSADFEARADRHHFKILKFVRGCERWNNFPADFISSFAPGRDFMTARAILKVTRKGINPDAETVALYSWIYSLVGLLRSFLEDANQLASPLLMGCDLSFEPFRAERFRPESVQFGARSDVTASEPSPAAMDLGSVPDQESEELRRELRAARLEIKALRAEAAGKERLRRQLEETEGLLEEREAELVSLREALADAEKKAQSFPDAGKAETDAEVADRLRRLRCVVVGGDQNFQNKLRALLPDWDYVGAGDVRDASFVSGRDLVFFLTDHVSHKTYNLYSRACRDLGVPLSFLHGVNLSSTLRRMDQDRQRT